MVDIPGLLSDAYTGWEDWWHPKSVPTGAAYDPETLGSARAGAIGNLGGNLLALSQGGLSPETRASLMMNIGKTPLTYQQSMLAGIEGRLHGAQAAQAEQEVASTKEWSAALDAETKRRAAGGAAAPVASTPGSVTPRTGTGPAVAGDVGGYARTALAALKGPESGGQANNVNQYGYSGLYQIGTSLANSAGLYEPAKDEAVADAKGHAVNAWRGTWNVPGFGPMTHQQFLATPAAQQAAAEKAMEYNWGDITKQGLDRYVGQTIGNVTITPQGLLQAAWLGGVGGLKTWLSGTGDPIDANKTPVSRWAALQPPGGVASDAGVAQPVPAGAGQSGGAGAGYSGPAGGTDAPVRRSAGGLSALTADQLTLMKGMTAKEARTYLLQQGTKIEPTKLSPTAVQQWQLDPRATWVWDENGTPKKIQDAPFQRMTDAEVQREGLNPRAKWGWDANRKPVQIEEAQSEYLTPQEVAARPNLNPRFEYQRDGKGNIKQVGERPAEILTDQQKIDLKIDPSAVVYRKADGTLTQTVAGLKRWATLEQKKEAGYPPDAKLLIGPDGSVEERDKGFDPHAPLDEANARATLIRLANQVKAKTLDENSPEGLRYKAAYDMLARGKFVEAQQPDNTTKQVWQTEPVAFPRLGAAPAAPEGVTTKQAPPLSEFQGKTETFLTVMEAAEKRMHGLTGKGYDPGNKRDLYGASLGSGAMSTEGQLYRQAQIDWYRAKLRWESGASIGDTEAFNEAARYFARPLDGPEVIKQKEAARQTVMQSMQIVAGRKPRPASADIPPPPPGFTVVTPNG